MGQQISNISGIIAVFAIALNNITTSHINFAVQFNVYALVSFFSAFIDLVTILIVILKKRFSFTTAWLLLFLGAAALMALAEGLQRLSIHPSAALFWQDLYYVGLSGLPLSFYLFIVSLPFSLVKGYFSPMLFLISIKLRGATTA